MGPNLSTEDKSNKQNQNPDDRSLDHPGPDRRWYGRRRGKKLRPRRRELVDTVLPQFRLSLDQAKNLASGDNREIWMEIGFGAGEHLAALAEQHPEIDFIGAEPFVNGVAALISEIDDRKIRNIRIYDDDVRPLLDELPEGLVSKLFILFPDPWPKTRHHSRRMMVTENIKRFSRLLKPGGQLLFVSDHEDYAAWSLERMLDSSDFHWLAETVNDWRNPPTEWPDQQPEKKLETRYQEKAQVKGIYPVYLKFERH